MRAMLVIAAVALSTPTLPAAAAPAPTPVAPSSAVSAAVTSAPAGFTSMPPVRVLDTRFGTGAPVGPVGQGGTLVLDLSARVPATATAVVLNVTGTEPTANTYVTVYPDGSPRPISSSLNLAPGETRPNLVTVAIPASRRLALFNHAGSTHLVADLAGYYATDATARYTALAPNRIHDSRQSWDGPLTPGGVRELDLSWSIPESATAVTFNLTGTEAYAETYVTAWPTGSPRPNASNLNLGAGDTSPNLVTVAVGQDRRVSLFNHVGWTHVIVDLAGFYTPDYGARFTATAPARVLDTRIGTGGRSTPLGRGESWDLRLGTRLPARATGVVFNLTGTNATASTYVAARPAGAPLWHASNLNLVPGQTAPNLASTGLGPANTISLFNNAGTVHLIADLAGWFEVDDFTCDAGCVHAWGWNWDGQLGTGSVDQASNVPAPVWGLDGITAVAGGGGTGYALRADGTVVAWGSNDSAALGNGWTSGHSAVPVPVLGVSQVTAIAAGGSWGMALRSDGTVWTWGSLYGGSYTAEMVFGLSDVVRIATGGGAAYALRADGTVWAWGSNQYGQLGDGTTRWSQSPVRVHGLTDVTDIGGSTTTGYAVRGDGTVWAWGTNYDGLLGVGSPCTDCWSGLPVQVTGLAAAVEVEAGGRQAFVLLADGTVRAWGDRDNGALGDRRDCCEATAPVRVSVLAGIVELAANHDGGYALTEGGALWGWGDNRRGQLAGAPGVGEYTTVPVQLPEPTGVSAIEGGSSAGFALVP